MSTIEITPMPGTHWHEIHSYLRKHAHPDLAKLYDPDMEVVAWEEGRDRPYRSPYEETGELLERDFSRFDLSKLILFGQTGWDWVNEFSRYFVFDLDGSNHGDGLTEDQLRRAIDLCRAVPWLTIRRSKSGKGVHVYIMLAKPMRARSRSEHIENGKYVFERVCEEVGEELAKLVDCVSCNAWIYARETGPLAFEPIKMATAETPDFVLPEEPKSDPLDSGTDLPDELFSAYETVEPDTNHLKIPEALQAAQSYCDWTGVYLDTHTYWLNEVLKKLGWPLIPTVATGKDGNGTVPNCRMWPRPNGRWYIERFSRIEPEWSVSAKGKSCIYIGPPKPAPTRPQIKAYLDRKTVEEVIAVLSTTDNVLNREGTLVEVCHNPPQPRQCLTDNGSARFRFLPLSKLNVIAESEIQFVKLDKRGKEPKWVPCAATAGLIRAVHEYHDYSDIPVATGVASCPILRADGTIAGDPGYDPETGLYLDIDGTYPSLMEPVQAREILLDIISEFPFATEAHRSAWIAALITLVARHAFIGNSPVFLADGNCPGIGKGLATDLLTMIVEGRKACRHTFPGDNDELRKLITSIVMSGAPYCLFDNIKGNFGGQAIENALTSGRWKDRLLGVNREIDIPLQLVWLATSNNATLTKDMPRRTCHIRLETDLEHPETRSDFKYPNLLEHVKRHRRQLVMAALSIPAAYIQTGKPDRHLMEWASFEGWSALVRSSIVWAGLADPDTRVALGEIADEETSTLHQLVYAWEECFGNAFGTVGDAITSAETGQAQQLNELLNDLPGDKRRTLGTLLRDGKSRVLDGRKIERADGKRAKWRIVPVQGVSA